MAAMVPLVLVVNKYDTERKKMPEDQRYKRALRTGLITAILFAILWILFGDLSPVLFHATILMAWFSAVVWLVPWSRYQLPEQRGSLLLGLVGIPGAMFVIYMLGETAGHVAMRQESRTIRVVMNNERDSVIRANLLRSYEQCLLLKDEAGEIRIVKWQDVARVEGFRPPVRFKGISCSWFDIACE
jgi:hypothetical protein